MRLTGSKKLCLPGSLLQPSISYPLLANCHKTPHYLARQVSPALENSRHEILSPAHPPLPLRRAPLTAAEATPSDKADREVQPGVPQGKVTAGVFTDSKIFPGTRRDYSVYVPAQYKADEPACLMVFMDGPGYANTDGAQFRVPVVFDNLDPSEGDARHHRRLRQPRHGHRHEGRSQRSQQSLV